ncbi:MAG TPA: TRAP transporter large permease subunit [Longimicrobiales bacterium]|nr:TRAP transporter large permease subunit [Longimicrobiales bacterium]
MTGMWLAPAMFVGVFVLLFLGYPVAFSLGGVALAFAAVGVELGFFDWHLFYAMPERIFGIMSNFVLLAVPYFIFMGVMLERARLAEDLLTAFGKLFGPVRGGLAVGVVFVGILIAAATGVVGASVVAMGSISLPVMLKYGYSKRLACGTILAAGTLGQIIPPSIVLVVLSDQLGVSTGSLFVGAMIPGLMLAGAYAVYAFGVALVRPAEAPALPSSGESFGRVLLGIGTALVPPLLLIFLVLGSIFAGVATPTEAGAVGALGATLLAAVRGRLDRGVIRLAAVETAKLTTMVAFLLIGSTMFALVFRGLNGDLWIEQILTSLPGGRIGLLFAANLAVFVLGFFLDFFEIAFILVPLLVPAASLLGIDLVWFGVMLGANLQTSFLTPPFGPALFFLRGVAPPQVTTADLYRAVIPFVIIQLIILGLVIAFPGIVVR